MSKVLLITVGGSPKPIITAIRDLEPERTIFVCSDGPKGSNSQIVGPGKPCEIRKGSEVIESLPNIPTYLELSNFDPERDLLLIKNPDDLSECYQLTTQAIRELREEYQPFELMADYTGGTKTMSVSLAMAAFDYQIGLYVTTSQERKDLIRVTGGEATERASTTLVNLERTVEQLLPTLLEQYNYSAALSQLRQLLLSAELPSADKNRVQQLRDRLRGLDAWDRFDHATAWNFLSDCMEQPQLRELGLFLKKVMSSRSVIAEFDASQGMRGHGYEVVQDLLLNADRRAKQERYDDAVGRLYRALELLVQIRLLQKYEIKTGAVDVLKLPESLREKYNALQSPNGKVQLPLLKSYELLSEWDGDPLGQVYLSRKNEIVNALEVRNHSLFAHGFTPISKVEYNRFSKTARGFIEEGIAAAIAPKPLTPAPQFSTQLNW